MAVLAPLAAMLVQMAVSRSREFQADASGARMAGQPWGLAKALEKLEMASKTMPMHATPATAHLFIVNPLSGGGFATPLLHASAHRRSGWLACAPWPRRRPGSSIVESAAHTIAVRGRRATVSPFSRP